VDDVAALIEAHTCSKGICHKNTHLQVITVEPADVATTLAELATLVRVRDDLLARGYQLLESEPTPRFDEPEPAAKPWTVRYQKQWGTAGPDAAATKRRGWLSRLWTPEA
jgi:hypothetical protein